MKISNLQDIDKFLNDNKDVLMDTVGKLENNNNYKNFCNDLLSLFKENGAEEYWGKSANAIMICLSLFYYLSIFSKSIQKKGDIKIKPKKLDDKVSNESIGFKELYSLLMTLGQESLSANSDKEIVTEDIINGELTRNVKLSVNQADIVNYMSTEGYYHDISVFAERFDLKLDNTDAEIRDTVSELYGVQLDSTKTAILDIYSKLFESGYGVDKFFGVLSSQGCFMDINNTRPNMQSTFIMLCNKYIDALHFEEVINEREFNVKAILSSKKILYYPFKMREFAFGCNPYTKTDKSKPNKYTYSEHSYSWEAYSKNVIEPQIEDILLDSVVYTLERKGCFKNDSYKEDARIILSHKDTIIANLDKMKLSVTACIILSECVLGETASGKKNILAGFKLRIADINKLVLRLGENGNSLFKKTVEDVLNINVDNDKRIVCSPPNDTGGVLEFFIKMNDDLYEGSPLFAYKALDSVKRKGKGGKNVKKELEWKTLIIGRKEDGKILSMPPTFTERTAHLIIAGSRSGKGVMTMNMLASAICSKKLLFYLDRKPDIGALLLKFTNNRACVVNCGAYSPDYDITNKLSEEEVLKRCPTYGTRIPDYVAKGLFTNDLSLYGLRCVSDYMYFKAIWFFLNYAILIIKLNKDKNAFNRYTNNEAGVVFVIDECTNGLDAIEKLFGASGMAKNFVVKDSRITAVLKENKNLEENGKKPKEVISNMTLWLNNLFNKVDDSLSEYTALNNATGAIYAKYIDFISIGQNISGLPIDVKGDNAKRGNTYDSLITKTSGYYAGTEGLNPLYKGVCSGVGNFDVFFGYNKDHNEYMGCNRPNTKAATKLTDVSRNFVYVQPSNVGDLGRFLNVPEGKDNTSPSYLPNTGDFFKPFLVLAESDEDKYAVKELKHHLEVVSLNWEDIKSKNLSEEAKKRGERVLEPRVGFENYVVDMYKFMHNVNDTEKAKSEVIDILAKPNEVLQKLLNDMGYDGTFLDYLCDMRPEWQLSHKDMLKLLEDKANWTSDKRCPIIAEYRPEMLSSGAGDTDEEGDKPYDPPEMGEEPMSYDTQNIYTSNGAEYNAQDEQNTNENNFNVENVRNSSSNSEFDKWANVFNTSRNENFKAKAQHSNEEEVTSNTFNEEKGTKADYWGSSSDFFGDANEEENICSNNEKFDEKGQEDKEDEEVESAYENYDAEYENDNTDYANTDNEQATNSKSNTDTTESDKPPINFEKEDRFQNATSTAEASTTATKNSETANSSNSTSSTNSNKARGSSDNSEIEALKQQNELLRKQMEAMQESMTKMMDLMKSTIEAPSYKDKYLDALNNIISKIIPQERYSGKQGVYTYDGEEHEIKREKHKVNFRNFFKREGTDEEKINSYVSITNDILEDMDKKFGLNRIYSIAIVGCGIVINDTTAYIPEMNEEFIDSLPEDVKNQAKEGLCAWLFNFGALRKFKNLSALYFDDMDFVLKKVSADIGRRGNFEPKHLFDYCKSLNKLVIGEYSMTRATMNKYDEEFKPYSAFNDYANRVDNFFCNATRSNFESIRSTYNNSENLKLLKATGMAGLTAVTFTGAVGTKLGKFIVNSGKTVIQTVKDVINAEKQ